MGEIKKKKAARKPKYFDPCYKGSQVMAHGKMWFLIDYVPGMAARCGGNVWLCACADHYLGEPMGVKAIDCADMSYRIRVGDEMVTYSVIEEKAKHFPAIAERLREMRDGVRGPDGRRYDRKPSLADTLPQRDARG